MTRPHDRIRSIAVGLSALAVIAVPNLGPLIRRRGEQTDRYDTAITPPGYAFTVWAPIFLGIAANAVRANTHSGRLSTEHRQTDWPLAGAYTLNTAWSLAAQSDRFALTPVLLPAAVACTALAHARAQRLTAGPASGGESITSVSTGLLLGWTCLAATVNLSAGTQLRGADPTSRASVLASTAGLVGAGAALGRLVASSGRGSVPLALPALWGTATTALDGRRTRTARAGALASFALVGIGLIRRRLRC